MRRGDRPVERKWESSKDRGKRKEGKNENREELRGEGTIESGLRDLSGELREKGRGESGKEMKILAERTTNWELRKDVKI